MALFRKNQSYDSRVNFFFDLPNMQWHGNTLIDKNNLEPIKGNHSQPLLQIYNNNLQNYSYLCYYMPDSLPINNYISLTHNFGLGQYSNMVSRSKIYQNIPNTNYKENLPKSYIIDELQPNIVYFIKVSPNFISENTLVKYNMNNRKVIWQKDITTIYLYNNSNNSINKSNGKYNLKFFRQTKEALYFTIEMNSYASTLCYGSLSNGIIAVKKEDGNFIKHPRLIFSDFDYKDNIDIYNNYGIPSLCAGLPLKFIDNINNESLFFTSAAIQVNKDRYASLQRTYYSTNYNINHTSDLYYDLINFAGFVKFNLNNHLFNYDNIIKGTSLKELTKKHYNNHPYATYIGNVSGSTIDNGGSFRIMCRPSDIDKTIKDKYAVYMNWGILFPTFRNFDKEEFRRIYRFEYDKSSGNQRAIPMNTLNINGTPMTAKDYDIIDDSGSNYTIYSQPYLLYNEDDKYLIIYDNVCTNQINNKYNALYLYKFINDNTVKLVDKKQAPFIDLLWIDNDKFVGASQKKILIYRINYKTNSLDIIKIIQLKMKKNKFTFTAVDDINNFWYMESIFNNNNTFYTENELNYINEDLIERISINKEKDFIEYLDKDIETYIDIAIFNAYEDKMVKTLQIDINGNAKFKSNNSKRIIVKSKIDEYVRVPIVITGIGKIIYNIKPISE